MTILARIYREPAALIAFATAVLAVLTGLSVLTEVGATIALGVVAAAVGLLRYFVTPASEVVVQRRPDGVVLANDRYRGDTDTLAKTRDVYPLT